MEYFIAWWNLENFFDVANSTDRPEWLQKKLNSELVGLLLAAASTRAGLATIYRSPFN